jgi:hypothetical protein
LANSPMGAAPPGPPCHGAEPVVVSTKDITSAVNAIDAGCRSPTGAPCACRRGAARTPRTASMPPYPPVTAPLAPEPLPPDPTETELRPGYPAEVATGGRVSAATAPSVDARCPRQAPGSEGRAPSATGTSARQPMKKPTTARRALRRAPPQVAWVR